MDSFLKKTVYEIFVKMTEEMKEEVKNVDLVWTKDKVLLGNRRLFGIRKS